jgi:hypothetical protein
MHTIIMSTHWDDNGPENGQWIIEIVEQAQPRDHNLQPLPSSNVSVDYVDMWSCEKVS